MRRLAIATLLCCTATSGSADLLVFVGGAIAETEGAYTVKGRRVEYRTPGGKFLSVDAADVDLAASAFLSSQAKRAAKGETRSTEPSLVEWAERVKAERAAPAPAAPAAPSAPGAAPAPSKPPAAAEPVCTPARLVGATSSGSVELALGDALVTTHLACLVAPLPNRGLEAYLPLAADSIDFTQQLIGAGGAACLAYDAHEPQRDEAGHAIGYVRLADGRDLGAELVRGGFAIARARPCTLQASYRELERAAREAGAGLWSPTEAGDLEGAILSGLPRSGAPGSVVARAPARYASTSS